MIAKAGGYGTVTEITREWSGKDILQALVMIDYAEEREALESEFMRSQTPSPTKSSSKTPTSSKPPAQGW